MVASGARLFETDTFSFMTVQTGKRTPKARVAILN